jgi:hypothetical protein
MSPFQSKLTMNGTVVLGVSVETKSLIDDEYPVAIKPPIPTGYSYTQLNTVGPLLPPTNQGQKLKHSLPETRLVMKINL